MGGSFKRSYHSRGQGEIKALDPKGKSLGFILGFSIDSIDRKRVPLKELPNGQWVSGRGARTLYGEIEFDSTTPDAAGVEKICVQMVVSNEYGALAAMEMKDVKLDPPLTGGSSKPTKYKYRCSEFIPWRIIEDVPARQY